MWRVYFLSTVYGWSTTQLVARERDEPYSADIVVKKGTEALFNALLKYEVRLVAGGTAST